MPSFETRVVLPLLFVAAFSWAVAGCSATRVDPANLASTLPREYGGFDLAATFIDEADLSGVPADDILSGVGKGRTDATVVIGSYGPLAITALVVSGVSPSDVARAAIDRWSQASVTRRETAQVSGHEANLLTERSGATDIVLEWEGATYVVSAPTRDSALRLAATLVGGQMSESSP